MDPDRRYRLNLTHEIYGIVMLMGAFYFIIIESAKVKRTKTLLGIFQLAFHVLVIIVFIVDAFNVPIF
jgi:hypothetical protein